jgi:hypothetical protein
MRSASIRSRVDAVTAEVVRELRSDGVRPLLLRGPSIAAWLYDEDSQRVYVDSDLLVGPSQFPAAERCLARLGFRQTLYGSDLPGSELAGHPWKRGGGEAIDLHWTLAGAGASPSELWASFSAETDVLRVDGEEVDVPGAPARALIVALHAAHHGTAVGRPLEDLARACETLDASTWRAAAHLAERLEATDPFTAGLVLHPAGRKLAARLGLPGRLPVQVALRAGDPPPGAVTLEVLASARGLRSKLAIAGRKLVPSRRFMRTWYPRCALGGRWMLAGYLWRPVWLLLRAWPALRAWRRARAEDASGER